MDELIDKVADKALNIAAPLLDLFFSGMQNKLMEKRIDNAVKTIELIKSRLSEYGVKVDYEKYFTEKLQVPLELVRAISDVESDDQRELLQNLFMRHLLGKYDDDGFYPSFINIIKELTSEDIRVLMSINEEEDRDYLAANIRHLFRLGLIDIYHEIVVPKTEEEAPSVIDGEDSHMHPENVTWGLILGEQKAMQAGKPYMTSYGKLFVEACTSPLMSSVRTTSAVVN